MRICNAAILSILIAAATTCPVSQSKNLTSQSAEHEDDGPPNRKQDETTSDMWSMVASMRGNEDASPMEYRHTNSHPSSNSIDNNNNGSSYQLDWQLTLDAKRWYELEWTVKYAANEIIFALNIDRDKSNFRPGYDVFALGFSSDGQLAASDYCLIWYDLSHRVHLQDARTDVNNTLRMVDAPESVCKFVSSSGAHDEDHTARHRKDRRHGQESGGSNIEIVFKRPLDVCNSPVGTYYMIDNGTSHLVWFTLKGPLLSIDGLNLSSSTMLMSRASGQMEKIEAKSDAGQLAAEHHHSHETQIDNQSNQLDGSSPANSERQFQFGMRRVQLIGSGRPAGKRAVAGTPTGRSGLVHDIRMAKYEIPARETTYWCKLFKLPHKFETKRYHITKYEAVISEGNEHVVHHMELFNCANLNNQQAKELDELHQASGWAGECSGSNRPKATEPCRKVVLAWAMGAQPLVYPEQVGQSIGGQGYSPYVVLEVHYNNVNSAAGLVDNSGLRFHYTNKLRPFDAGILEVGLEYSDKNSIPPQMLTPLAGYCSGECTRVAMAMEREIKSQVDREANGGGNDNGIEKEGIYIFAAQLHTHLTGVASWTEQIREGKLVRELQRDDHYSPHFQEIRLLPEPINVQPGDSLVHYCLYDTRGRQNITLGGFATTDEMCVTYLHYYPRMELEVCKSSVDSEALGRYFAYLSREESQNTSAQKSVSENYHSIDWSARRSRELIQFYSQAPLSIQCNQSDGSRFPGHWNGVMPTQLWPPPSQSYATNEPNQPNQLGGRLGEPLNSPLPLAADLEARRLVAYRGRDYKRRHASCSSAD